MSFNPADYRNRLLIGDGDWRAELRMRGWERSAPWEQAISRRPDIVRDVAGAFLDAGANVLVTPTVRADVNAPACSPASAGAGEPDAATIHREGTAILRAAISDHGAPGALLFGAMGPTLALLMLKETTEIELRKRYAVQAQALAAGGVDAILCQGFSEIRALSVAVDAAREASGLPVIAGLVFGFGSEQSETSLGVTIPQACAELAEAGAAAIGADDAGEPDNAPALVKRLRRSTDLPTWVRMSAGTPHLVEGDLEYPEKPEEFGGRLGALAEAGANYVAGGRGATVAHIAALALAAKRIRDSL